MNLWPLLHWMLKNFENSSHFYRIEQRTAKAGRDDSKRYCSEQQKEKILSQVRNLGSIITSNLKWDLHMNFIVAN